MSKKTISVDVFEQACRRIELAYKENNRLIFAFSGGKDSSVLLELGILVAKQMGRLPVEVSMRDDEIMYPGTFEFAERIARRPEVNFHWISARQGQINIFNRKQPFFWVFDPKLEPEQWVRQPPWDLIEWDLVNTDLYNMINSAKYPPPESPSTAKTVAVKGIRTEESSNRNFAILASKGSRSRSSDPKMFNLYPIYDWKLGDIWKAIKDNKWDYNEAYDVMKKMGVSPRNQRIALIAMFTIGIDNLQFASRAWPRWFQKVCDRLPGVHSVTHFGSRALLPYKKLGETWEECFHRTCLTEAPDWIKERSYMAMNKILSRHNHHSNLPFPDIEPCPSCKASWKTLTEVMYTGDPFKVSFHWLPNLEPSMFRPDDPRVWPKGPRRN